METPPIPMMDVQMLLECSRPQPRILWARWGMGFVAITVLAGYLALRKWPGSEHVVSLVFWLAMAGIMVAMVVIGNLIVQGHRTEMSRLQQIEELVQLRRWPEAAMLLGMLLMQPMRTMVGRVQALLYLTAVMGRMQRFDDVVLVDESLLSEIQMDRDTAHLVKLSRAMALLREDRLFDADRAIGDLRRDDGAAESPGLALVEMYRDVKTGHPDEAIALFEKRRETLKGQLGHRVADAWILAARAYDFLARTEEARQAFDAATLLAPLGELQRRYPEITVMVGKYAPHAAPPEVA